MNVRLITLLALAVSSSQFARAGEVAAGHESVQLAQASSAASAAREPAAQPPQVTVHGTRRGVIEAAAKGPDALRRYVDRTRMIYGYRFQDFAHADWYR
ncbi:MAG TPA: hypothetical protein VMU47_00165 [Caldimonas sp.]|nr:hypothetical protein [Caldimonas sp.]